MSSIFDIQQGLPPITTLLQHFFQTLLPNIKYNTACNRSAAAGFSRIVFFYFSIFQCVIVIFCSKHKERVAFTVQLASHLVAI